MPTFALNFSRPGGQIIAQYYNFCVWDAPVYTKIQQACADTAQWLADELNKLGIFDPVYDGRGAPAGGGLQAETGRDTVQSV